MEEKIIKIIIRHQTNMVSSTPWYSSAREISALFREFIEWKDDNVGASSSDTDRWYFIYGDDPDDAWRTLDELFDYWWSNIKNK